MRVVESGLVRGGAALVAGAAEADLLLLASDDALLLIAADGDKVEQRHRIMHDGSVSADLAFTLKPGDAVLLAGGEIGRAHVCTPVTNAQLVCRLLLEKKKTI